VVGRDDDKGSVVKVNRSKSSYKLPEQLVHKADLKKITLESLDSFPLVIAPGFSSYAMREK